MALSDLDREHQVALVALVEAIAISDGTVSAAEGEEIGDVATDLGEDKYRELLDEAESRFADVDALREFLVTIDDKNARETIYGVATQETLAEISPTGEVSELLNWLANAWDISVQIKAEHQGDS